MDIGMELPIICDISVMELPEISVELRTQPSDSKNNRTVNAKSSVHRDQLECPMGFHQVKSWCYALESDVLKTWDESQTHCRSLAEGGRLAEFKTEKEFSLFRKYFTSISSDMCTKYWIGAEEIGKSNQFKWSSSQVELTFYKWYLLDQEPNLGTANNAIGVSCSFDWIWLDADKNDKFGQICEVDPIVDRSQPVDLSQL
ncbi:unnamed protein product [Cyprideis torosa]|uniref:Uncharacterized protein n=1 Tax=Cyprideis torosa TaxID=163714 RepID=A0A7R8WUA9_9CRUS|nr:unnamed protein product [Cyprideis torosa]CAG0906767.1 unnamed protein product [Cyprideis torosa]